MNRKKRNYSDSKNEKITAFMSTIMPYIKADNSLQNIEYVISFELQRFYNSAFVAGQMSVLEKETIDESEVINEAFSDRKYGSDYIKYLDKDSVTKIIINVFINHKLIEKLDDRAFFGRVDILAIMDDLIEAICKLAIPDIDGDKIIEVLEKYFKEYNFGYLDGVADAIIKAIRGEE